MPLKPQVYKDERPAEHFTRFHETTRGGRPDYVYQLVRMVLTPYLLLTHRVRCIDSDKVPVEGPAIIAPNHFSFMDHFFIAVFMRRKVQFMAKSQLFKPPMQFIYEHGGVFPIRRGHRDEEGMKTARIVLDRGNMIVMYAEGGRSRTEKLGDPKPGIGRLALETGAPVVPSAIVGSAKVRNWKKLQFPKVTVQYGEPIRFEKIEDPTREQAQAAADVIFEGIENVYYGLLKEGRKSRVRAARAARRAAKGAAEGVTRRPTTQ
ncbi:MAG: 1-acyl-sn-glycerol-3-phosphate acyltransferase [Thermoleophilales bacterium]|jgi:1-acyl-sn-glycerol-3-phosphate acyltransferase|nr:1-acyl-sn-glycerol-3-phosphate acyltransferase [Thermoleophilales bacterium]